MTVENIVPYISYTSNGTNATYVIPFYVEAKTNFSVRINGVPQNYANYVYNDQTNSIAFNSIPSRDTVIELTRETALTRGENYDTFSNKLRPDSLNGELDRVWRVLQELTQKDTVLQKAIDQIKEELKQLLAAVGVTSQDIVQFPITSTTIRINLPDNRYSTIEPFVICTVLGGPTNVTVQPVAEYIQGIGEVFTYINFSFPSELVGKKCNVWLTGG